MDIYFYRVGFAFRLRATVSKSKYGDTQNINGFRIVSEKHILLEILYGT